MAISMTFTPGTTPGDTLSSSDILMGGAGVFGEGSDTPVLVKEDDGSYFRVTGVLGDGSFTLDVQDMSAIDPGRRFRRVAGAVAIDHSFQS